VTYISEKAMLYDEISWWR